MTGGVSLSYTTPYHERNIYPKLITYMHRDNIRIVFKKNIFGFLLRHIS